MPAEIIEFRPPTRVVGEGLRCPICGRGTYTNVVAQSYGVCMEHRMYWRWGQNVTDNWLRQTPKQWAVNAYHLVRMTRVYPDEPRHSDGAAGTVPR